MKSIKWDAFDKSDACDKFSVSIVHVPPVADREGIVERKVKTMYICTNFSFISFRES